MKKEVMACTAIAALCSATTIALADDTGWDPELDEVIAINDGEGFTLFGSGDTVTFTVTLDDNPNPVVGFSFAGVVQGVGGTGVWASDTRMDIVAPDGTAHDIGGFGTDGSDNEWDFQGSQSTDDGLYVHGLGSEHDGADGKPDLVWADNPISKGGEWTFTFTQTFGGEDITWKGVSINLHKLAVPAPGALALLGLAGLVGARRRRRS